MTNPDFKNENGTTRIIGIWDQDRDIFYDSSQIDRYLDGENPKGMHAQRAPGFDISGHGTNVARIACGNRGVASKSDILVVKMGNTDRTSFSGTTQLIKGIDFCIKKAADLGKPVAINISYGNNYGDHSGSSIQESFINTASASWKCAICVGSGNEGLGAGHTSGRLRQGEEQYVQIAVSEYETSLNIQIWKDYWDDFNIEVITPAGINLGRISRYNTLNTVSTGTEKVLCYYAQPLPFSMRQEIYIDIVPVNNYITSGLWRINFIPDKIRTGFFDMWLPTAASLNPKTGFTRPDSSLTYTVPSTSSNVITVGSYNAATNTLDSSTKTIRPGETLMIFNSGADGQHRHRCSHHLDPGIQLFDYEDREGWVLYDPLCAPYYRVYDERPEIVNATYDVYTQKRMTRWEINYGVANYENGTISTYKIKCSNTVGTQVTVDGVTHPVPQPFIVLATQNPGEFVGTYPLPEAQMDRFFLRLSIGYPTIEQEMDVLERYSGVVKPMATLSPVCSAADVIAMQEMVTQIYCSPEVRSYVATIAAATRQDAALQLGASTRAAIALIHGAQACALLAGRDYIVPEDVQHMAVQVLAHRLVLSPEARMKGVTPESVVRRIIQNTPVPVKL